MEKEEREKREREREREGESGIGTSVVVKEFVVNISPFPQSLSPCR